MMAVKDSSYALGLNWGVAPFAEMQDTIWGGTCLVREIRSWLGMSSV